MNIALWVLQVLLAAAVCARRAASRAASRDRLCVYASLRDGSRVSVWPRGTLAAVGLTLPGVTRDSTGAVRAGQPRSCIVMVSATIWHLVRQSSVRP